jgi:riboflavin synthase alpha subunit
MAVVMKIVSLFHTEQRGSQSEPKFQRVDKAMIYQAPEKSISLDGVAVTLKGAFLWNESEYAVLRESFLKKSVEGWTVLVEDAPTFSTKAGI